MDKTQLQMYKIKKKMSTTLHGPQFFVWMLTPPCDLLSWQGLKP